MVSPRMLTRASWYQAASTVALTLLGLWLWPHLAIAIFAGGLLMTSNFAAMRFLLVRALKGKKRKLAYGIALSSKFAVVLGALALLVLVFDIDPMGIAIGMSSLFIGIGLATAHGAFDTESEQPAHNPLES